LSTGHFSGKLFFEGHFSGHTGSNDTGLEFLSCEGWEKGRSHTYRQNKDNIYIYIYRFDNTFEKHNQKTDLNQITYIVSAPKANFKKKIRSLSWTRTQKLITWTLIVDLS
jgi:hypothetical protein